MFGAGDKITLTLEFFSINKDKKSKDCGANQEALVLSLPLSEEEIENLELPQNMDFATVTEYQLIGGQESFSKAFNIYIGEEISGQELSDRFGDFTLTKFFHAEIDRINQFHDKNGRFPFWPQNFWDRRHYYIMGDQNQKFLVTGINNNDKVVQDINNFKRLLIEISREFDAIKQSAEAIKKLGLTPKEK